jgi:hypothetical protein
LACFCHIYDNEALEIHAVILNCACKFEKMSQSLIRRLR